MCALVASTTAGSKRSAEESTAVTCVAGQTNSVSVRSPLALRANTGQSLPADADPETALSIWSGAIRPANVSAMKIVSGLNANNNAFQFTALMARNSISSLSGV